MDSDDVHYYIEKLKRRNKDLRRLFSDLEHYKRFVETQCCFPHSIKDYNYVQEGMAHTLGCVASIIATAKEEGGEDTALSSLIRLCSRWSCASLYSDDHYADTERARGENSMKIKFARWLRNKAGE